METASFSHQHPIPPAKPGLRGSRRNLLPKRHVQIQRGVRGGGGVTATEPGGSSPTGTFQGTAGLALSPRGVTTPRASCESENLSFFVSHRHPNGSQRRQTAPDPTSFYFLLWFWFCFFIFSRDYSGEGPAQLGTSAPVPPATVHSKSCLSPAGYHGEGASTSSGVEVQGSSTAGTPPGFLIPVLKAKGLTAAPLPQLMKLEISSKPKSRVTPPPSPRACGEKEKLLFGGKPWEKEFGF